MGNYKEFLYDELGNEYRRKNTYLRDLARLEAKKDQGDREASREIEKLKANKSSHEYIIELEDFKKEEQSFLKDARLKKKDYEKSLDSKLPRKYRKLKTDLYMAELRMDFYRDYRELSYDAELNYGESEIIRKQLPNVLLDWEKKLEEIDQAEERIRKLDPKKEEAKKEEIKRFEKEEKENYRKEKKAIKERRRKKEISEKAKDKALDKLKREHKESLRLKSYELEERQLKDIIKNRKTEIKLDVKTSTDVINANISDLRRQTPVELEKKRAVVAYLTILFPGLGQLLNGQTRKGLLLLISSFFIYFMAIPYALGFGNYQGEGIRGLISLAEGGLRIEKSLIFMIEGVIAVFLLIISLVIIYLSFKDARKVERDMIRGIRPHNWFETKSNIKEKGFPYLVTSPALILIVFIILVPVTTTILLSFTGMDPQHQSKFSWIGLKNYKMIALGKGLAGSVFWSVLSWTIIWTLAATSLAIFLGFGLALLTNNERIKGKKIFRTIFILPWAVPAFITIMFFSIMMSPHGAITELLNKLTGLNLGIKTSTNLTRMALIFIQGWLGSSYIFLLITGVLQAIPGDLYEAADIDGASRWDKLRKITLPIVLFQTAPILIGQYTFNFNNFSIIYLFNSGGPFDPSKYGNLAGSSDILISYIYKLTMENQYQAIGAAITVVISSVLMFVTYIGYANSKAFKEERL